VFLKHTGIANWACCWCLSKFEVLLVRNLEFPDRIQCYECGNITGRRGLATREIETVPLKELSLRKVRGLGRQVKNGI